MEKISEFEILKKLHRGAVTEQELTAIYDQYRDIYRVLFYLVQHPRFPENFSLNIIPDLFSMDLVRVVKNTRTRPYIRKRAELEFTVRYQRFPKGEKISYMKLAPRALLEYFVEEEDKLVIDAMLHNANCNESLIAKFILRKKPRFAFYEALGETDWFKRPQIAEMISQDQQAPIKMMIQVIPFLGSRKLRMLLKREDVHQIVKKNIIRHLQRKKFEID